MGHKLLAMQLVKLANIDNEIDKEILASIIERLFLDLESGHSCSKLSDIIHVHRFSKDKVLNLLENNSISTFICGIRMPQKPLSIVKIPNDYLIYISRYLAYEINIIYKIEQLNNVIAIQNLAVFNLCVNKLNLLKQKNQLPNTMQLNAIMLSVTRQFSIITGGPGTGKTTTVTLLLWMLYQLYGVDLQVKICAPTGKASSRVKESILASINYLEEMQLDTSCFNDLLDGNNFTTIHKLLGYIHQSIYFKHNKQNPLDIDVLIIDESSMISLPLFSKLLSACDPNKIKHIIFLGDENQLSSVEEGYVFASLLHRNNNVIGKHDLFSGANNIVTKLLDSKRNQGDIGQLANAILAQNLAGVNELLSKSSQVKLLNANMLNLYNNLFINNESKLINYLDFIKISNIKDLDYTKLFNLFMHQNTLCLTNIGILGAQNINQYIEKHVKLYLANNDLWYLGRPIIVLENDYSLDLNNGDIGICIIRNDNILVVFENGQEFIPEILPKHSLAYAITIHKSQGSEYNHVNIVLTSDKTVGNMQELLSRELIYTAVTRAKNSVTIFSDVNLLAYALTKDTTRNSGLVYI